eukprot:3603331-Amphidinium_carterae.1
MANLQQKQRHMFASISIGLRTHCVESTIPVPWCASLAALLQPSGHDTSILAGCIAKGSGAYVLAIFGNHKPWQSLKGVRGQRLMSWQSLKGAEGAIFEGSEAEN